jgi:hypothetical protein
MPQNDSAAILAVCTAQLAKLGETNPEKAAEMACTMWVVALGVERLDRVLGIAEGAVKNGEAATAGRREAQKGQHEIAKGRLAIETKEADARIASLRANSEAVVEQTAASTETIRAMAAELQRQAR